ncbi:MAG: hypothetical protein WBA72_04215 [Ornithinimicrobium sp.]
MRWSRLFDDLEAQLLRLERVELEAEVSERARSERGQVAMAHALAADCGREISLDMLGVGRVAGVLSEVGQNWCILESPTQGPPRSRSVLLALPAVQSATGLTGFVDSRDGASQRRFGMRSALRVLSRDRARVRIHLTGGGTVQGTIDRVGWDHCDVADHADDAPRRGSEVRAMRTVPLWAVSAVRQV